MAQATISPGRSAMVPGETLVWSIVGVAWLLAIILPLLGLGAAIDHHAIFADRTLPLPAATLLFLATWQLMTAGMMLPSSVPLTKLFAHASAKQPHPKRLLSIFLGAYFAVWTGFAVVALVGDGALHWLVGQWRWLDSRPWLIAGSVLILAGIFQFTPLKDKCLDACRSPMTFMWRFYGRGSRAAWTLGFRHGLFCVGCCWALMLMMFALGLMSIAWMAAMTGVMVLEKSTAKGRRLVPIVGVTLLIWGVAVLLQPDWLPTALGGASPHAH